MIIKFHKVNLKKKFPLQISRGVHSESQNAPVRDWELRHLNDHTSHENYDRKTWYWGSLPSEIILRYQWTVV